MSIKDYVAKGGIRKATVNGCEVEVKLITKSQYAEFKTDIEKMTGDIGDIDIAEKWLASLLVGFGDIEGELAVPQILELFKVVCETSCNASGNA